MGMSLLDQVSASGERYDQANQTNRNDYVQPLGKTPAMAQQKPSMGAKLSKVAEIFELDIIDEDEALKACKVIIEQHTKARDKTGPEATKIVKT